MDKRFTGEIVAAAQLGQVKWGVPAAVTLAQWALESAYGRSMPAGSNNPFGIKARAGEPSVESMTWEVIGGKRVNMTQNFRKYDSLADAFDAHGKLLATSHYYVKAMAVRTSPEAFANALTGVYATDPNYGSKLIAIMKANDLFSVGKSIASGSDGKVGSVSRESVRALQNALVGLGYTPGAIDGYIGPNTMGAVEELLHDYQPNSAAAPAASAVSSGVTAEPATKTESPVDIVAGVLNTLETLGASIGASGKVVAAPNVNPTSPSGAPITSLGGISGAIADGQRVAQEIQELVDDWRRKDLKGGLDDVGDLLRAAFSILDRFGLQLPVVSQVVRQLPDLDPAS